MEPDKKIDPKAFVIQTLKAGNSKRIAEVLKRYYAHVKYYKKEKPGQLSVEQVMEIMTS